MALFADRVKETTTTTGTGTVNLAGASTGFQTFVAGIGDTNECFYLIADPATGDWEIGRGTVTDATPDTLARDTILQSSNADAAVNFSAGTKTVACVMPAVALGEWVSFTPTGSWTTNTTYLGFYRLVGDTLELRYEVILAGAPDATKMTLDMPSGFTIDAAKLSTSLATPLSGRISLLDSGTGWFMGALIWASSEAGVVRLVHHRVSGSLIDINTGTAPVNATAPFTFASGDKIYVITSVPVTVD